MQQLGFRREIARDEITSVTSDQAEAILAAKPKTRREYNAARKQATA